MFRLAAYLLSPAIFVAVLLAVIRQPAAAVTATFSLTGAANITAPCPVDVAFSGSISGAPGSVTYLFARFVNGKAGDSAPVTAVIPPSGTLAVNTMLSVDSANAGFQSYGLFFTSPLDAQVGGRHKSFFTVTCSSGAPPPSGIGRYGNVMRVIAATPPPTGTPPPSGYGNVMRVIAATPTPSGIRRLGYVPPAAPQNFRVTHDFQECMAHSQPFSTDLICNGSEDGKHFSSALIWEAGDFQTFTLYVGGKRILYRDMPIPCCVWRNVIPRGECAFVRAINQNQSDETDQSKWVESANSNTVCNNNLSPMKALVPAKA